MSNAHTPGPWEARGLTIWEPEKTALSVAVVTQHEPNARANARLIAAAPDMLAALERLADFLERTAMFFEESCMPGNAGNCTIKAKEARAAIAKAEGRT